MNKANFQLEQGERQMAIAGGIAPSSCTQSLHCSASLQTVKQLTDAMHHHIQEANRYALELRKYALPKMEHEMQTPNAEVTGR